MKNWPKGYQEKIESVLGSKFSENSLKVSFGEYNNASEARLLLKRLALIKKELSAVKKEANEEMKIIRSQFQAEKEKISQSGGGFTQLFFGKKSAGRARQSQKVSLNAKQQNVLTPYENVKLTVDQILLQIDKAKFEIEQNIARNNYN